MSSKKPLMTRIVIAFVLMTALFSGLFSLSIVLIVHVVEEHLVTEGMHQVMRDIRCQTMLFIMTCGQACHSQSEPPIANSIKSASGQR